MGYSVGKSSFGELAGVEQFVASADVSNQVASLCYEFDTTVAKNGDRLTVNEGIRSRPRQKMLREAWDHYQRFGTPWASLAATIYNSTHDESRGSALDFGITRADGSNRALTQGEFDWVHTLGVRRGIQWTGRYFNPVEQWHHNGGYPASVPAIKGVIRPGEPLRTPSTPPAPEPSTSTRKKDDDMVIINVWSKPGDKHHGDLVIADGLRSIVHTTSISQVYDIGRSEGLLDAATDTEPEIRTKLSALGLTITPAQLKTRVKLTRQVGGYVDPSFADLK